MNLLSIRVITADTRRLAAFYEQITGLPALFYTDDFAELKTSYATLAIAGIRTLQLFGGEAVAQAAKTGQPL